MLRSTALSALPYIPHATPRYSALLRATPRYCVLLRASLRYAALHCAPTIRWATPRYAALFCPILGYPTLFYSINCKLTTGLMDVETDEGCDDPATYSK